MRCIPFKDKREVYYVAKKHGSYDEAEKDL
jgi:hypothetical protein